jgi:hypothetical protein
MNASQMPWLVPITVAYLVTGVPITWDAILAALKPPRWSQESKVLLVIIITPLWLPVITAQACICVLKNSHAWPKYSACYIGRGVRDIYRNILPSKSDKIEVPEARIYRRK